MTAALGYHGGLAAEEIAERAYLSAGHELLARRWRGQGGEIDLVTRRGNVICFIEVKKARSHQAAAARLSPRQIARIQSAALEFADQTGSGADSDMQFDVALVDEQGRLEIIEAAFH